MAGAPGRGFSLLAPKESAIINRWKFDGPPRGRARETESEPERERGGTTAATERRVTLQNVSYKAGREAGVLCCVEMLRILPDMSLSESERETGRERGLFSVSSQKARGNGP